MADVKNNYYTQRYNALKQERTSWIVQWRELSGYVLPRSGRYFTSDRNRGEKRHNNIYDSTGTRALRTLAAGMMSGMTSPARPWFRLATADSSLMDSTPVKLWLSTVADRMRDIYQRSNTYRTFHSMYTELGLFGTAAAIVASDFDDVVRTFPLTAGEYCIATDDRGVVTTLAREFDMTVGQVVKKFGIGAVSDQVKNLFESPTPQQDTWITVIHVIEPNYDRDPTKMDAKNLAWKSVYLESGKEGEKYLSVSGFKKFTCLCPRWDTSGGDIYGNSPMMDALGDVKQLQHAQLRKAQGIDYMMKPPVQLPTSMRGQEGAMIPGGTLYYDGSMPNGGIRSAYDVRPELTPLLADIQDVRDRINQTMYADLFLMLSQDDRSGITATEVAERHEEKLIMLGPVLERLNDEMLAPMVNLTFQILIESGLLPQAPPQMHGMPLNVQFVSMLAQAQQAVGTNAIDRFIGTVGQIAQLKQDPSVWDKVNTDETIESYADMLGIEPNLINSDDDVASMRAARQKQQAAAQAAATAPAMAQTAQTLSQTDTTNPNALTALTGGAGAPASNDPTNQFAGYGSGT